MSNNTLRDRLRARRKELNSQTSEGGGGVSNATELSVLSTTETPISGFNDGNDTEGLRQALSQQRAANIRRFEETDLRDSRAPELMQSTTFSTQSSVLFPSAAGADDEDGNATPVRGNSLRSRMKAKMEANRTASPTTTLDESNTGKMKRIRDRMVLSNRFVETLKRQSTFEESQLNNKVEDMLKSKSLQIQSNGTTEQDCYDFFTKEFEPEEAQHQPPERQPEENNETTAAENEQENADGEQEPPVVNQGDEEALINQSYNYAAIPDEWRMYEMLQIDYRSYQEQLELENVHLFIPNSTDVAMDRKLGVDKKPRYLELEGFYVGKKPYASRINRNILENRLLAGKDEGVEWFGLDGQVDTLPDPTKMDATRPWHLDTMKIDRSLEVVYIKAFKQHREDKYLTGDGHEIQIDLSTIVFHHHPLMSKEHVLASNIQLLYNEYVDRRHKNYITFFTEKLQALRDAVDVMLQVSTPATLESLGRLSENEEATIPSVEDRMYDYMSEIRLTTRQLNITEMEERELMRQIIDMWGRIKQLRERQGYTNTSVKLTVQTEEVDYDLDLIRWTRELKLEVKERKMEFEATVWNPYRVKVRKYKIQLREWKHKRKEREQAAREESAREDGRESDVSRNDEERAEISDANDLMNIDSSNRDRPVRPITPGKFNKELVTEAVKESLLKHRRNPGEARMWLLLAQTAHISEIDKASADEQARRKAVNKSHAYLKVFFNNQQVFTTRQNKLTSDFRVSFGSIFRIVINEWPENFRVNIYDAGMVLNTLIGKTTLNIPEVCVNSANVRLQEIEFIGDDEVSYDHAGVGSKVRIGLGDDQAPAFLPTRGHLIVSVSWGIDEHGEVLAPKDSAQSFIPPEVMGDAYQMYKKTTVTSAADDSMLGVQDPEALSKWLQEHRIDPNHPDNAAVVPYTVRKKNDLPSMLGGQSFGDFFRLEQLQESFNFVEDDFTEQNRFRLLMLRFREELEFRTLTMIPASNYEILDSAFAVYEHRIRNKDSLESINVDRTMKGPSLINEHRIGVLRFRQRIRDAVLFRFHISRHYFTFEDMIHEDSVPDVKLVGDTFKRLLKRRRPLKPERRERKKATTTMLSDGQVNLLVNVIRGYNVPTRGISSGMCSTVVNEQGETFRNPLFNQSNVDFHGNHGNLYPVPSETTTAAGSRAPAPRLLEVAPFVTVTFQNNTVSTSPSNGPQPNWNEELRLPFTAPNSDYSPNTLQTCNDNLYINLFDKFKELIPACDIGGEDGGVEAYRIINNWLGSFIIPFSTIFHQGKIEGTYRLRTPPVLLGYNHDYMTTNANEFDQTGDMQIASIGTYLTVFITVDPVLKPMEAPKLRFESQESEDLLEYAEKFVTSMKKKSQERPLKATVVDIKGEPVFITRFVSPLAPPSELFDSNSQTSLATAERLARYVSLIPTEPDNVAFAGVCDLWCTCDQFLNMLCGDEEEHAILLLNYFLYLNKEAYLMLCEAVPEGETSYVLTVEAATEEYLLWNACTGEWYSHKDPLCPVVCVGTLVNSENIWVNIQASSRPNQIRYRVDNVKDWKPIFNKKKPNPGLATNQPASLIYVSPDMTYVSRLSERIERVLKDRFTSWRPRHITKWNRTANSALYKILKDLEQGYSKRFHLGSDANHAVVIREVLGDVSFTGFPMSMPFTDIDDIVSRVRATDLHKVQIRCIEFSLAVHIHPYPGGVLAVWIYVASIINRRRYNY